MLPAGSRLRRRADFVATVRSTRGVRGTGLLVVHAATPAPADPAASPSPDSDVDAAPSAASGRAGADVPAPQVGFVVSRAVGAAVVRNRVRRRLRHLVADQLDRIPPGSRVVVRALPGSAVATYEQLEDALRSALDRSLGSAGRRGSQSTRPAARA